MSGIEVGVDMVVVVVDVYESVGGSLPMCLCGGRVV
jgi:hypothetical protein